jgi:hypothetical protein
MSPRRRARSAWSRYRQPIGLESPRSPFSTPISTSAASIAASSPSPSDSARPASAPLTDAISASSVLSTLPASSCFRNSSPRPPTASFAGVHTLASVALTSPAAPVQIKHRPRLPAPFPRGIRGGRVVGVVSELKAQVRRGCSGAQGWTCSPPFRPPFRPPLRPHLGRSAGADSASTETGPTPTTNWPSRWTRRTRKGGVRRQAYVAGHLRPDVRRFGEVQGSSDRLMTSASSLR